VQPLGSFSGSQRVWLKMLPCWLCALVFATPQLFIFVQVEEVHPGTGDDSSPRSTLACKSVGYTAEWQRKAYFTFLTAYILVVPTIIMVYCYVSIIRVVWLRSRPCRSPGEEGSSIDRPRIHFVSAHKAGVAMSATPEWRANNQLCHTSALHRATSFQPYQRQRRETTPSAVSRFPLSSKRTVVKMTMLVVVGFVVCWTPYFAVSLIRIYSDYRIELDEFLSVSEIMALGHSAVNPLLYMIYSRRAVSTFCCQVRRRVRCSACHRAADRPNTCPSPPPLEHPPPSAVYVAGNGRDDGERGRTRRKWFLASGADGNVGPSGGARSAPCHVTCSWSSSSRREVSAATDCQPYRRHRRLLTDDKLVPLFTAVPVTSCRLHGTLSGSSRD